MRMLTGFIHPTATPKFVVILSCQIKKGPAHIGYVPENALYDEMDVREFRIYL